MLVHCCWGIPAFFSLTKRLDITLALGIMTTFFFPPSSAGVRVLSYPSPLGSGIQGVDGVDGVMAWLVSIPLLFRFLDDQRACLLLVQPLIFCLYLINGFPDPPRCCIEYQELNDTTLPRAAFSLDRLPSDVAGKEMTTQEAPCLLRMGIPLPPFRRRRGDAGWYENKRAAPPLLIWSKSCLALSRQVQPWVFYLDPYITSTRRSSRLSPLLPSLNLCPLFR